MEHLMMNAKGLILIPKRLRDKYGLKPGAKNIAVSEEEDGLHIHVVDRDFIRKCRGMLKKNDGVTMQDFKDLKGEDDAMAEAKWQRLFGK